MSDQNFFHQNTGNGGTDCCAVTITQLIVTGIPMCVSEDDEDGSLKAWERFPLRTGSKQPTFRIRVTSCAGIIRSIAAKQTWLPDAFMFD